MNLSPALQQVIEQIAVNQSLEDIDFNALMAQSREAYEWESIYP